MLSNMINNIFQLKFDRKHTLKTHFLKKLNNKLTAMVIVLVQVTKIPSCGETANVRSACQAPMIQTVYELMVEIL